MEKTLEQQAHEQVVIDTVVRLGISGLNSEQKVTYYRIFCENVGLNPAMTPFNFIKLNGRETLYCGRSGVQQLCQKYGVSHRIISREIVKDIVYAVSCRAELKGRQTESIGAVPLTDAKGNMMTGDALSNAMMKAETKAKRRSTLDLLGLGMLDESEIDSIPGTKEPVFLPEFKPPEKPDFSESVKEMTSIQQAEIRNTVYITYGGKNVFSDEERIKAFQFSTSKKSFSAAKKFLDRLEMLVKERTGKEEKKTSDSEQTSEILKEESILSGGQSAISQLEKEQAVITSTELNCQ